MVSVYYEDIVCSINQIISYSNSSEIDPSSPMKCTSMGVVEFYFNFIVLSL